MTRELDGIYAAAVTPFDANGALLAEQIEGLMRYFERKGADGVLICGTTGEAASMSVTERIQALNSARAAGTKLRMLVGTGAASIEDAVTLTRNAFDIGADGVVVLPPFFNKEMSVDGLFLFYDQLITRAVPSDGRLLLYHNPVTTITSISFELIHRLCDRYPEQIVGIKDSGSDLEHSRKLNTEFPHFHVFVGDDRHLSENLAAGGAGAITGVSNIFCDLLRDVRTKFAAGEPVDAAQERVNDAHSRFQGMGRLAAFKTLLVAGRIIPEPTVRPPLKPLGADERALLEERFHLNESMPGVVDLADLAKIVSNK
jgi:4-hydroxy-tetrahydrodipicolinate synthase